MRDLALQLLQQWATAFAAERSTLPAFADAVARLQAKGVQFPGAESGQSAPVFTPPPAMFPFPDEEDESAGQGGEAGQGTAGSSAGGNSSSESQSVGAEDAAGLAKLADNLKALQEKINLCREMLPESPGVQHDETLAEVIGFLEACQPRMVDLVEAGMQGLLGEELLMTALQLNDDLATTLEAERTGKPLPPQPAAPSPAAAGESTAGAPAPTSSTSSADQTADLLGPMTEVSLQGDEEELVGRRKDRKHKPLADAATPAPAAVAATPGAGGASATAASDGSADASSTHQPNVGSTVWPPLAPPAGAMAPAPPRQQQFEVPVDDPFKDLTPPTVSIGQSSQPPAAVAADPFGAPEIGFTPAVATSSVPATPLSDLDAYETPYLAPSTHDVLAVAATDGVPIASQDAQPSVLASAAPIPVVAASVTPAADPFASLVPPPATNPEATAGQASFKDLGKTSGAEVRRSNF